MEFSWKRKSLYLIFFGSSFVLFHMYFYNAPLTVTNNTPRLIPTTQFQTLPEETSPPKAITSVTLLQQQPIVSRESTLNSEGSESFPSFLMSLSTFDWNGYEAFMRNWNPKNRNRRDLMEIEKYHQKLMLLLTPFLEKEPLVPINSSCMAPPLIQPSHLKCKGHGNAFDGALLSRVPKIGILIQFGFDVDVLEIYLNEVYDVIDQFFIIESTKAHFRSLRKALLWENVKNQPRFQKFAKKITHFIIDDAEGGNPSERFLQSASGTWAGILGKWRMENLQEKLRWIKFLQWNAERKFFSSNDLIGFGDSDEIPSRETLHMMKHCALTVERLDIGIWFPFGNIRKAFASDFPVPGHKYTLGDPTFWTLGSAMKYYMEKKTPGRMRGASKKFLLGGIHMTHYGYSPYRIMRDISCSECSPYTAPQIRALNQLLEKGNIRDLEIQHRYLRRKNEERMVDLDSVADEMKEIAILPWFYECNKNRYPVWDGGHDSRLD